MTIAGITTYALVNGVMIELTPEQVEALGCGGAGVTFGGISAFLCESVRAVEAEAAPGSRSVIALRTASSRWARGVMKYLGWRMQSAGDFIKGGKSVFVLCDAVPACDCGPSPLEGFTFNGLAFVEPDRLQAAINQRMRPDVVVEGATVGFDADGRFEIRRD